MKILPPPAVVGEVQGLYGPLQVLELKIQEVWGLQQFQAGHWKTRGGSSIKVLSPGIWNRGAGPDFLEAVIEMEGQPVAGDVEIHLYREDWWRHGHDRDPAYNNVILHVVLFGGGMERKTFTVAGAEPPEWIMGPWMREDIESVSGGEPGLFGELVPGLKEWLESDSPAGIRDRLKIGADRRWQAKRSMARGILDSASWKGALHRMVLYYLGVPFNRKVFYRLAEAYPPEAWGCPGIVDQIRSEWKEGVNWGSGRPANRAQRRLTEYHDLNREVPDWFLRLQHPPAPLLRRLEEVADSLSAFSQTRAFRRCVAHPEWQQWLVGEVLGDCLGSGIAQRLWVDVFLPGLAARGTVSGESAALLWIHTLPGFGPSTYAPLFHLAGIGVPGGFPSSNGWTQGILWLEDQFRLEKIRVSTAPQRPPGRGSGA